MKTTKTAQRLGLVFDFNAITELEDKHGINLLEKAVLDKMALTPSVVRKFVWAGLLHKQPELTLEQAGKKLELTKLSEVIAELQEALVKAFQTP